MAWPARLSGSEQGLDVNGMILSTDRKREYVTIAMAFVAAALSCEPASAGRVVVPEGCEGFLTVQMKACGVSHYWRCAEAPEGTVWEVHYNADGAFSLSVYDREFQWLDSSYFFDEIREQLVDPGPDSASLSTLLSEGEDSYAFVIRETTSTGTRDIVHQGFDRLTGQRVVIDGQELLVTEFASAAMDAQSGEEIYAVAGQQFILEQDRLFLLGADTFSQDGEERDSDRSPLRIIRAGEPGFLETEPQFDCAGTEDILFTPPSRGDRG